MSKLTSNSNYDRVDSGNRYSKILSHFQDMAAGRLHNVFLKTPVSRRFGGNPHSLQLRYVDMASEHSPSDMPKMEVVDLNQIITNRAIEELDRDIQNNNCSKQPIIHQSSSGHRKRRTIKQTGAVATKVTKRARDYFDK